MERISRKSAEEIMNYVIPFKQQKMAAVWIKERVGKLSFPRYVKDELEVGSDGKPRLYDVTDEVTVNVLCHWIFGNFESEVAYNLSIGWITCSNIWEFDTRVVEIRRQQLKIESENPSSNEQPRLERRVAKIAEEWRAKAKELKYEYERRLKNNMENMLRHMLDERKRDMEYYRLSL